MDKGNRARVGLVVAALFSTSVLAAQEVVSADSVAGGVGGGAAFGEMSFRPSRPAAVTPVSGEGMAVRNVQPVDSLSVDSMPVASLPQLPPLYANGTVAWFPSLYYGGGWDLWNLHEGFNAALSMSVSASFGKHRFPGVGFGTGISAMYVHSLTDRLVLGVGGFYDRLSWSAFNRNRFGLNFLAGYRLTDRVSIFAYGSKAFSPDGGKYVPVFAYPWLDDFSSRFGGMVHFKVSDAFSFSVSVEETKWNR